MDDFCLCDLAADWTGSKVLLIAHWANKCACLTARALEDLVDAPFGWQEGWSYTPPTGWPDETYT